MKKSKTQKGITLVALIITIIVLLILAVVAIRAVQGDGIIAHAKNARDSYNQAQIEENGTIQNYVDYITGQIGPNSDNVAYTVGQKVMVGTEKFYVMADSDATQDKVTLLSFENIDTTNLVQSASAEKVAFSSESYWKEGIGNDIVEPETIPGSHIAAKAAYDYGAKLKGTGRLMTYREANTLSSINSAMLYGTETTNKYLSFWLGTSETTLCVWNVDGKNGDLSYADYTKYDEFGFGDGFGVRPIVEVLKSKVSLAP